MSSSPDTNEAATEGRTGPVSPAVPPVESRRPRQTWTVTLAAVGQLMVALDTLIVTTSLPAIRAGLKTNFQGLEWPLNPYTLGFASGLLLGAALGDRFGRRRTFLTGIGLFAVASALAALA